jgi:hypothetical protein
MRFVQDFTVKNTGFSPVDLRIDYNSKIVCNIGHDSLGIMRWIRDLGMNWEKIINILIINLK